MSKLVYPNGITITVNGRIATVTTAHGYDYIKVYDQAPTADQVYSDWCNHNAQFVTQPKRGT